MLKRLVQLFVCQNCILSIIVTEVIHTDFSDSVSIYMIVLSQGLHYYYFYSRCMRKQNSKRR